MADDHGEAVLSSTLVETASNKQSVPKLCETRWTARVDNLSALISKYKSIRKSLNDVSAESSDSDARLKAGSHSRMLQSSQFIVALVVSQHVLSFTRPLSQALQKTDCDIVKACVDANNCKRVIREQRQDQVFESLWKTIATLAECVEVEIEKPRTARRMAHRSTAGDINDTALQYYKVNVFFPFIDHCLNQLEDRFPEDKTGMFLACNLMPKKVATMTGVEMAKVFEWYDTDLPESCSFYTEIQR